MAAVVAPASSSVVVSNSAAVRDSPWAMMLLALDKVLRRRALAEDPARTGAVARAVN